MSARVRGGGEYGRSFFEYLALGMVAVLILASLTAVGLQPHLRAGVSATICRIVHQDGKCRTEAASQAEPVSRAGTGNGEEPEQAPPPHSDGCHGFWGCAGHYGMTGLSAAGGVVVGIAEGAWGDLQAMYGLAKDPSGLVEGLKYAIHHPGDAALSMVIDQQTRDAWERGDYANAVGRVLYNASSLALGAAGAAKVLIRLGRLAKVEKAAEAAKAAKAAVAAKAAKAAEIAKKAGKDRHAGKEKVPKPPPWLGAAAWREGAVYFDTEAQSHRWLDANLGKGTRSLDMNERRAVFNYRFVDKARAINESLWGETPATPETARNIKHMDTAMEKVSLPEDLITTRLVGDDAFDRPMSKVTGTVQTKRGYVSVSAAGRETGRKIADSHITRRGVEPVRLHLRLPKGTKVAYPGNLWEHSYEPWDWHWDPELIVHRNLSYRIDHAEKVGDTWEAYATVIP